MKRYLCPICDQELTARSYCPTCRKIVKNPTVYDGVLPNEDNGNYLLNHQELHPDRACVEPNRERVCEIPQEKRLDARFTQSSGQKQEKTGQSYRTAPQRSASSGTVYQQYRGGQSTAPGSQIWKSSATLNRTASRTSGNTGSARKGKKGCRSGCLTVFIVFWLISFIIGIIGEIVDNINIDSWLDDEYEYVPESKDAVGVTEVYPDTPDESVSQETADEYGYIDVDYEKILAIGERCTGYWHYPVSGAEMYDALMAFAETEMGLAMTEQSDYMLNEADTAEYGYTYYDSCHYWDWEDGYFAVGSDSVSGDIHYIYAYSWNADEAIEIVLEAFGMVEGETSVKAMRDSLYGVLEKDDLTEGYYFDMGASSVWICEDEEDGYYMVEVYPVTE